MVYKQILSDKTLSTPRIAFLFLTDGDVNYPNIWKKYFDNNLDNKNKYNIYMFTKKRNKVDSFLKKYGIKLGFMSFFVKAVVASINEYPILNAAVEGNNIIYNENTQKFIKTHYLMYFT